MGHSPSFTFPPLWFVVLPDSDAAAEIAAQARTGAAQEIPHSSGRPWLVGRWPQEFFALGVAGASRIAVFGEHATTSEQLGKAAAAADSPEALHSFATRLTGSFHLTASIAGEIRVQGSIAGLRRVFHGGSGPVAIAGDRADVVAGLLGRDLDERRLAVQLLTLGLLHPLSGRPVWHGLEDLPGGHWLKLTADGRARPVRWWTPPQPDLSLAEGAARFRDALATAVDVRTRGRRLLTADLGGLDSTAVYCLAARGGARVLSYTAATHDSQGDDVHWARRTVGALGQTENHHVVPAARIPLTFDGLTELDDQLDAPSLMTVDRNRRMSLLHLAAEQGSPLHLTGLGGDELLAGSAARLHGMVATRPRDAVPLLRGYAAKYGWSRRRVLRQLLDRRPYRAWLAQVADDLRAPQQHPREPLLTWSAAPRLPPWATAEATEAVRELITAEAADAEPLGGGGHGLHRELVTMRLVSQFGRHIGQMAAPLGVACAAPYYDDRVVEAALAVDDRERITPYRYKPLIVEAMRGIVPEESRSRATKANATLEEEAGLREHRDQLLALCEQSRLGDLGLIDVPTLREWTGRPLAAESESELLHPTVACEVWLRSQESHRASSPTVP